MAKLSPIRERKAVRKPGFLKGKIRIAKNFDAPLPARVLREFERA